MKNHHILTIQNLKKHYEQNSNCHAIIITGSVARGDAGDKSDVDYLIVADEQQYAYRVANNNFTESLTDCCIAPCPEVNGIWTSRSKLEQIRDNGKQLERWTFYKALVVFSRDRELEPIITSIPIFPENHRQYRMESYYSQIFFHFSFFEFAFLSKTIYLIFETATKMVLSIGRLFFEDNRILYPGRKWFWKELSTLPDKPNGICQIMLSFLDKPTIKSGSQIIKRIQEYKCYPVPSEGMKARIYKENMLNLEEW